MPRPKKEGAVEPKRRSRTGCWPCKARKVKCGEEKPRCLNCERQGEACDYSIRLNWGGRKQKGAGTIQFSPPQSPHVPGLVFPSPEVFTGRPTPSPTRPEFHSNVSSESNVATPHHSRSHSNLSLPPIEAARISVGPLNSNLQQYSHHARQISHDQPGVEGSLEQQQHQAHVPTYAPIAHPARGLGYAVHHVPAIEPTNFDPSLTSTLPSLTAMRPPYRSIPHSRSPPAYQSSSFEEPHQDENPSKRARYGNELSPMAPSPRRSPHEMPTPLASGIDSRSPGVASLQVRSPFANTRPLTPGSSTTSDDQHRPSSHTSVAPHLPPPDLRRLSVNSLLVDSIDIPHRKNSTGYSEEPPGQREYPHTCGDEKVTTYGYDCGQPDLDTPKNDDSNAIRTFSPPANSRGHINTGDYFVSDVTSRTRARDIAFEPGGYYSKPVPIKIPLSLEPLPPSLLENKMNLLYFHHFLNHTANILVPHDCEQNPFRVILPEMAIDDPDLLNLLLAYSASHRSRLLHHAEPANRIALYVQDVFTKLRESIESPEPISIKSLATAITLASLQILSPSEFGINIPWRSHLEVARQMMESPTGPRVTHQNDRYIDFLTRWFAYLDVLGSLSGGKSDRPLGSVYWALGGDSEAEYQIDCLLGFTKRCASLLSKISDLIKQCESLGRLDANGTVNTQWQPPAEIQAQAMHLKLELQQGRERRYKPCPHRSPAENENEAGFDALEILTTNEMYHWAALIHLSRRVLNLPSSDPDVQRAVREIVAGLYKVRHGSTAEACLLFPMFTAGVNATDRTKRERIMSRLTSVENFGMTQVTKARKLMQKCWDSERCWEEMVTDEFFG